MQGRPLDLHKEDEADGQINTSLKRAFIKVSMTDNMIANNFLQQILKEHVNI